MGFVKLFSRSWEISPNLMQDWVEFVKLELGDWSVAGPGGINQICGKSGIFFNFLLKRVGLVKYFVVVARIGQNLWGNRRNWSKFLKMWKKLD